MRLVQVDGKPEKAETPNLLAPKVLGKLIRDSWEIATPIFKSEQRRSVSILYAVVFAITMIYVQLLVTFSYWKKDFYDALQALDQKAFGDLLLSWYPDADNGVFGIMPGFIFIASLAVVLQMYIYFLTQWLHQKGRTELTKSFLDQWLGDLSFYITSLTHGEGSVGNENPDQRIAEDCREFVRLMIKLTLELIATLATLGSFAFVLWTVSGSVTIYGYEIPHYMVWAAIIYASVGTGLTAWVGKPLPDLKNEQQRREADFRYALVRVREFAQAIALSNGAENEKAKLSVLYSHLLGNWWNIMWTTKKLTGLTTAYGQAAAVFPLIVAAPRYFAGAIKLGVLMQIVGAFDKVQESLSWFVDSYTELAELYAIVDRLMTLKTAIEAARVAHHNGIEIESSNDGKLKFVALNVDLPDRSPLLQMGGQTFIAHQSTLIGGKSGCGKSTLFSALAGIWPFGSGVVKRPDNCMFLPQHPYMPLGTLAEVLAYPHSVDTFAKEDILAALEAAGLGEIGHEFDVVDNWSQRLSGGQQQRISIVRALLAKPDWLFLDEATASLDVASEEAFFAALQKWLPDATIVSIAHRPEVKQYHKRHLVIAPHVDCEIGPVGRLFDITDSTSTCK
ncbi:MAG TPA: ABC transporter ATP-binding protein/permease [Drouetiella sp.]|jgi:vitamin B12/bleomycin/antimicrobial peptide transport system ATP-binding/permease protein